MNKRKKNNLFSAVFIALVVVISVVVYITENASQKIAVPEGSQFTVHMIDIGQGDCIFIDNGDNDILIDAGPDSSSDKLIFYLDRIGEYNIEYAFFTHPHEDHIGGANEVIEHCNIDNIVMPKVDTDSKYYNELIDSAKNEAVNIIYTADGDKFSAGEAKIELLSPATDENHSNLNLYSLVMRITYGESSFLFTGDAEKENEEYLLENHPDKLKCDVLKVGHHGSSTSSCEEFISIVNPDIALISLGEFNSYGHPHIETLAVLSKYAGAVYRTDKSGDVVLGCNGENVWVVEN